MLLVVNLNLAVDEIVHLEGLTLGGVHRAKLTERLAGGKGVNVARVLKALNEPALLTGFLGGRAGEFIARELRREEISFDCTQIQNESRTCIILDDEVVRTQTVVNEAGPEISAAEMQSFFESYRRLLSASDIVVITGSLAPKLSPDIYAQLISTAVRLKKPALVDTSSEPLRGALNARPFLVKINRTEASELIGLGIESAEAALEATRQLIKMGARHAMITLGARGAALNLVGVEMRLAPPNMKARNSVGSGDAAMAGLAAGLMRGMSLEETARLSIAAGAANALRGAGRVRAEDIFRLMKEVKLS